MTTEIDVRKAYTFAFKKAVQYLFWEDQALGTLNWATLPVGAYTGLGWRPGSPAALQHPRSQRPTRSKAAFDGNRVILNDQELRSRFPGVDHSWDPASLTAPCRVFLFVTFHPYFELFLAVQRSRMQPRSRSLSGRILSGRYWSTKEWVKPKQVAFEPMSSTTGKNHTDELGPPGSPNLRHAPAERAGVQCVARDVAAGGNSSDSQVYELGPPAPV